jgi:hypothetical protein
VLKDHVFDGDHLAVMRTPAVVELGEHLGELLGRKAGAVMSPGG